MVAEEGEVLVVLKSDCDDRSSDDKGDDKHNAGTDDGMDDDRDGNKRNCASHNDHADEEVTVGEVVPARRQKSRILRTEL